MQLQDCENKISDAILALESNTDNMESLHKFYQHIITERCFSATEQDACHNNLKRFVLQISELGYNIKMQIRRANVLLKEASDQKAIVRKTYVVSIPLGSGTNRVIVFSSTTDASRHQGRKGFLVNVATGRKELTGGHCHAHYYRHHTGIFTGNVRISQYIRSLACTSPDLAVDTVQHRHCQISKW